MNARTLIETMAAPVVAPPRPGIKPHTAPPMPGRERPDPWRRKAPRPGEKVRPKAAYGMDTTYSESLGKKRLKTPAQGMAAPKAMKMGGGGKGKTVAKMPGKVAHESQLPRPPLDELNEDGQMVAKSPGNVEYPAAPMQKDHKSIPKPSDGSQPEKAMKHGSEERGDQVAKSPGDVEYPGGGDQKKKSVSKPSDGDDPGKEAMKEGMSTSRAKAILLGEQDYSQALRQIREQFIGQRVRGFTDKQGRYHGPVSAQEAEQRWTAAEPEYVRVLQSDPQVRQKLGIQ